MYIRDSKRWNIYAPFTLHDVRYPNALDQSVQELACITQIDEPLPPADYTPETHYRWEIDDAPYVVFERKPDGVIREEKAARIQAQIDALEAQTLLPRVTREFMLQLFAAQATAAGVDPIENFGYRKVKELDDQITALRGLL